MAYRKAVYLEDGQPRYVESPLSPIGAMLSGVTAFVFGIIEALLAVRLAFRVLNANPDNGFVSWIYSWSHPLITPFTGIFHTAAIGTTQTGVFEVATLVAIVIYAIIGWLLVVLFNSLTGR